MNADISREEHRRLAAAIHDLRAQVSNLDTQIGTVHLAIRRHEDDITACKDLTGRHEKALTQLEQIITSPTAQPAGYTGRSVTRLVGAVAGATNVPGVELAPYSPTRKLNIDQFSEQQKRLLAVFFQNRNRELSYVDLAAALGKSAYTIKNQINQIKHKADLFDCVIGPQSRNFFRLKDDLRVEKHLKPSRPVGRPTPAVAPDQSIDEYATSAAQPFF